MTTFGRFMAGAALLIAAPEGVVSAEGGGGCAARVA